MSIRKVALPILAVAGVALAGCNNPAMTGKKAEAEKTADSKDAPKTEIPGQGWFAIFSDPTGNRLALYTAAG